VLQAFVVAVVIVVIGEGINMHFGIAGQVVIVEQNPVLECLMPAGLRMRGSAAHVVHADYFDPYCKIPVDVVGPVAF
jgi:hypothetical protein